MLITAPFVTDKQHQCRFRNVFSLFCIPYSPNLSIVERNERPFDIKSDPKYWSPPVSHSDQIRLGISSAQKIETAR